jgi:Nitrogen regulatory protein PII
MKLIIAIIRPDRLNSVLEALYHAEVRGLTVSRVMGHGGETERVENYRGTTVKLGLQEKVRLEIGVSDPSWTSPPALSSAPPAPERWEMGRCSSWTSSRCIASEPASATRRR